MTLSKAGVTQGDEGEREGGREERGEREGKRRGKGRGKGEGRHEKNGAYMKTVGKKIWSCTCMV